MTKHKFLLWKILGLVFILVLGIFVAEIWRAMHPTAVDNIQGTWSTFKPATPDSPVVTIMFANNLTGYKYAMEDKNYMASPFSYKVKDGNTLTITDGSGNKDVKVQMPNIDTLILINEDGQKVTFKRSKYDYGYLDTWY